MYSARFSRHLCRVVVCLYGVNVRLCPVQTCIYMPVEGNAGGLRQGGGGVQCVSGAGTAAQQYEEKRKHLGGEHDVQRQITGWRINKEMGFHFGYPRALLADSLFGGHAFQNSFHNICSGWFLTAVPNTSSNLPLAFLVRA